MDAQIEVVPCYVSKIREEQNIDERVMLLQLNNSLPLEIKLANPSLITNDFVSQGSECDRRSVASEP